MLRLIVQCCIIVSCGAQVNSDMVLYHSELWCSG